MLRMARRQRLQCTNRRLPLKANSMKARPYIKPVPPGEMLEEEFMRPLGMTRAELARRLGVPANRVTQILSGQRAITPETALRLEALLGWPADYWMRNQAQYDLDRERRSQGRRIKKQVRAVQSSA
ncbi:MAG: HigA family addiction module antitoxin [SAR324 cluster bacterium]